LRHELKFRRVLGGPRRKAFPVKILDRYILTTFLVPWLYCLMAFMFMYVVYDLFDHMEDFVEASVPIGQIALFYARLLPSVMTIILPVSLLLAVLYALYQLTKNNEIIAMRASGVGLYRLLTPFLLIGVLFSLLLTFNEETLAPWSAKHTDFFLREIKEARRGGGDAAYEYKNFAFYHSPKRRSWRAKLYDVRSRRLEHVEITQERPDGTAAFLVTATRADWMDDSWVLSGVVIEYYDEEGLVRPRFDAEGNRLPSREEHNWKELPAADYDETPEMFVNERLDPKHQSSGQILDFLRAHPAISEKTRAGYLTNFHMKRAMPWACLVVVMLGIPFGNQTARKGAMTGITLCLGMFFSYYIMITLFKVLGTGLYTAPMLAAWMPNLVFFSVAAIMMWRLR
jgi:lipopolysaccharide export system permease protein